MPNKLTFFSCLLTAMYLMGCSTSPPLSPAGFYTQRAPLFKQQRFQRLSSYSATTTKNQFIVKFKTNPSASILSQFAERYEFKVIKSTTLGVLVEKLAEESSEAFMTRLEQDSEVDYVEKNHAYRTNQ